MGFLLFVSLVCWVHLFVFCYVFFILLIPSTAVVLFTNSINFYRQRDLATQLEFKRKPREAYRVYWITTAAHKSALVYKWNAKKRNEKERRKEKNRFLNENWWAHTKWLFRTPFSGYNRFQYIWPKNKHYDDLRTVCMHAPICIWFKYIETV